MPDITSTPVARVDETPDMAPDNAPEAAPDVDPDLGSPGAQDLPHEDPDEVPAPDDLDLEAPEADVAEQRTTVVEEDERVWEPVPDGVDPADRTDQRRVVTPDEEEYR